jgi:hypothetical protein
MLAQNPDIVGPLTFDGLPLPSTVPHQTVTVDVPGFKLSGGYVHAWAHDETIRFYMNYGPDNGNCVGCTWPMVLKTEPGARNLRFHVISNDKLKITDGTQQIAVNYLDARFPLGQTITIPESTGTTYITVEDPYFHWGAAMIAIDDIQYERSGKKRYVRLTDETPGLSPSFAQKETSSGALRAHVALGAVFTLGLVERQGPLEPEQPVVSGFTSRSAVLSAAPVPVDFGAIDPTEAVTPFATPGPRTTQRYLAAHLGTQAISILPLSGSGPTVNVEVVVEPPTAIGAGPTTWDDRIVRYAHLHGIPPQVIKGVMQQETHFKPTSYRYEPFTTDWDLFSPHGNSQLEQEPYSHYRMESGTLQRGTKVSSADRDVRNEYDIRRAGDAAVRRVHSGDTNVTAYELYRYNDYEAEGVSPRRDMRWYEILSNPTRRAAIAENPSEALKFTAQTTVAASYGIMQILYSSAVAVNWKGDREGNKNPTLLFDTPENLERDGGSIDPATSILVRSFKMNMGAIPAGYTQKHGPPPAQWVWPPSTVAEWEYMWKLGLSQYNGKARHRRTPTRYGEEAQPRSRSFPPARPTPTFE